MTFGGKPKAPKISPVPRLQDIQTGSVEERERLKRAMGRSSTLLSRGLLFESPSLMYPQLFGQKTKLGQ